MLTSAPIVRRHWYETFLKLHQILAVAIITGVWIHVPRRLIEAPTIYLLIAGCVWTGTRMLRLVRLLFRNLRGGKYLCRAIILPRPGAVQVHIRVARPWDYRAG